MGGGGIELWADTGGTFTDCLFTLSDGSEKRLKVLSSSALRGRVLEGADGRVAVDLAERSPDGFFVGYRFRRPKEARGGARVLAHEGGWLHLETMASVDWASGDRCELVSPEEAPVLAARWAFGKGLTEKLPALKVRLATTRATNALLERRGRPPLLLVTRGFADLLRIGDQRRPDLFALDIERPAPLTEEVVEVDSRMGSQGEEWAPLELESLRPAIEAARAKGIDNAAISLLHSYARPEHEQRIEALLLDCDFVHVSTSSRLAPFQGYLARTETAVVDAYLAPVITGYLEGVTTGLRPASLHMMTSAGGLIGGGDFRARDGLLSGPAGGVVGAARAGRRSGFDRLLTFDMGGTSTDVARFSGDLEYVYELRIGDARLVAPAVAIETVAAGGGSICRADRGLPKVGPESAGARPGPACYGAGGPLTVTDVNLLLGRLDSGRFGIPLDPEAARRRLAELVRDLNVEEETLLEGFLAIANERMAESVRRISIRRGYDPSDHALLAFGGAGGQHACAVADLLGVDVVISPRDAGILSAIGLGASCVERFAEEQVLERFEAGDESWRARVSRLEDRALGLLSREGFTKEEIGIRRRLARLRLKGQETTLEVDLEGDPRRAFDACYRATYGYAPSDDLEVELESLRVVASTRSKDALPAPPAQRRLLEFQGDHLAYLGDAWREVCRVDRDEIASGDCLEGPALIFDPYTTLVVDSDWWAEKDGVGAIILRKGRPDLLS